MIWIIIAIVVIVIIVNSNKKKKQQQGQQPPQTGTSKPASKAASTAATKSAGKSAPTKPGAPPKAEPAKSSAPPKAGDKLDQDAFARAFAHMSGDAPQGGPSKAPAPEPHKPEEPKAAGDVAVQKRFQANILGYYDSLWNKDTGSLYTELASMPIHHFAVQVKEDRLVESVWLEGDDIPLVSETEFSKLCAGDESMKLIPLRDQQTMDRLYGLIRDYLLRLGTVELRDDCFYPLRPGQAPTGSGAPSGSAGAAPAGKAAKGFSDSDKEAKLRAQIQAMMEKQKKDNPPKK